jgi:3-deoxy-D-manno-octulosonic-acid transferase
VINARLFAYRMLQRRLIEPWLLPRWMSDERIREERESGIFARQFAEPRSEAARAWFHAASVGELESLTPAIEAWVAEGAEAVVTVLSESARGSVAKLRSTLGPRVLYAGYSPWEGKWGEALDRVRPGVFVTAKYEAWPELWASLAERGMRLVIVSAKARRSLRIAGALCRAIGGRVPEARLLAVTPEDAAELAGLFGGMPQIRAECAGEPRWDRVNARLGKPNARASALIERYRDALPRPWGILAQVWPEDMDVWRGQLGAAGGALWTVPHRVDSESVGEIEAYLLRAGLNPHRTSQAGEVPRGTDCVLVDEVGVLLDLYSHAAWAYVGGGFGVSMHSTIEPALLGVPIACGPEGEERFAEIAQLAVTGQLEVVRDGEMLARWVAGLSGIGPSQRDRWKAQAQARLGATAAVLRAIRGRP